MDVNEYIKGYKDKQYIEIEFRFGKSTLDGFDTNVGKDMFEKIKRRLHKYKGWEEIKNTEDEVYYWSDGTRCVYNEDTSITCKKHKIFKKDFNLKQPLDVRFAVSQEIPTEQPEDDATKSVTRKRTSFIRKNVSIDLTEVTGPPKDIDNEEETTYHVELEIIDPSAILKDYIIENIVYKVHDLLAITV